MLRFESSTLDKPGKLTSLADYVKRMPSDQKEIYCLLAANRAAAEASPYFEVFRERKWEVLFLYDPGTNLSLNICTTFEGKPIAPRGKGGPGSERQRKMARCRTMRPKPGGMAQGNARRQGRRSARFQTPGGKPAVMVDATNS
jgi:HSP90 family molecular chaperone